MNLLRERDYDKMQKYIDMSKTIASVQSSIKDIFEEIGVDKPKEKKVVLRKVQIKKFQKMIWNFRR